MPRYAVYTLHNARADYRQFFTLTEARAYAQKLDNGIIWDRINNGRA